MFPKIRGNGGILYWDSGKEAGIQGLRFPKIRGKVRVPIIGMTNVGSVLASLSLWKRPCLSQAS